MSQLEEELEQTRYGAEGAVGNSSASTDYVLFALSVMRSRLIALQIAKRVLGRHRGLN